MAPTSDIHTYQAKRKNILIGNLIDVALISWLCKYAARIASEDFAMPIVKSPRWRWPSSGGEDRGPLPIPVQGNRKQPAIGVSKFWSPVV